MTPTFMAQVTSQKSRKKNVNNREPGLCSKSVPSIDDREVTTMYPQHYIWLPKQDLNNMSTCDVELLQVNSLDEKLQVINDC